MQRAGGQSSAGLWAREGTGELWPRGGRPEAVKLQPRAARLGSPKLLRSLPKRRQVWGRCVHGLDRRELRLPVRAGTSKSVETGEVTPRAGDNDSATSGTGKNQAAWLPGRTTIF